MLKLAALPLILLLSATPALALNCYGSDPGLTVSFGFKFGDITEADEAKFDLMRLQRAGVDAVSVEYWNGCIRAWVKNEDGPGEHMEFYYPGSLRRVDE